MILRSIGARLAAAYLVPSLIGLGALGFWVDQLARKALEEELGRKVTAIAAAAAATLPPERIGFLQPGDEGTRTYRNLRLRLEELQAATGARRIVLFSPDERALVDVGGSTAIGDPLPELARDRLELEAVFEGKPEASQVMFEVGGVPYKAGYAPVGGKPVEAAILVEGSADAFAVLHEFRNSLAALGVFAAVCVIAVAFLFSRTLVAPIRRLASSARRIGGGDLSTPVPPASTEELGSLARTLEEMRERLLARDRQLQMMLAGIAHEVRNPLGGMELYSGLLLEELAADEEKASLVRKVRREIDGLGRLVNDFLDYAREKSPQLEQADARSLAGEAADLLASEASTRGVTLEVMGSAAPLRCDPLLIKRALLNLVRNAVQASPRGTGVILRTSASEDSVRIEVEDRGPGVKPGDEARIFEPFFTTREKGTGLGLAFVQRIAEAHGGTVRLASPPGAGALFVLELPAEGPRVATLGQVA